MLRLTAAISLLMISAVAMGQELPFDVAADVVYGHKDGLAMTFDAFSPKANANGAGVIFIVSGGWFSQWAPPAQMRPFVEPLSSKGFTVFTVRHGSSPKYTIPDAVADVRLAVRHIRAKAAQFKIDADRLGVYGISAGGHLSLMLGTGADEGMSDSSDPVLRASDRVTAVVAFVAPTDLTIMVKGAPERLPAYNRFPALDLDVANAKLYSPLLLVTEDDAPTLLLAGAKDDLVPIDHSRKIHAAFDEKKVVNKLVEFENAGHGFGPPDMAKAVTEMVSWFETHLAAKQK